MAGPMVKRKRRWPDDPIVIRCCGPMIEATDWGRYIIVDEDSDPLTVELSDDLMGNFGTPITYCPWCGKAIDIALITAEAQQ